MAGEFGKDLLIELGSCIKRQRLLFLDVDTFMVYHEYEKSRSFRSPENGFALTCLLLVYCFRTWADTFQ